MLFGKGIGKDDKLRLALLDYLKRYHPNDHETYTMVTLNFTMHREIASMLEEAAYQQLKLLENKQIGNWLFYIIFGKLIFFRNLT